MRDLILRLMIYAVAIAVIAAILPGIHIKDNSVETLLVVALVFGLVNAVIKPVVQVMSCPLIVLTLGLFALVINGLMLLITDALAGSRFEVDSFWWAVLGGIVIGLITSVLEGAFGLKDKEKDQHKDDGPVIIQR